MDFISIDLDKTFLLILLTLLILIQLYLNSVIMHRCVFMDVWVDLGMYTIAMLFLIWVVLSILVHKSMIK